MKLTARYAVIGMAVVTLACDTARRDNAEADASPGMADNNRDEVEYVEKSMSSGMLEVELGKLAQERASSPDVKQFAEMMVRDHTKAGEELKQVAQQHSIRANSHLQDEHRDLIDRLSALKGAEFDRQYMQAMVDSHQEVVDHLESRADDPGQERGATGTAGQQSADAAEHGIAQWATKTLPTAQHHLEEAERIEDRVAAH